MTATADGNAEGASRSGTAVELINILIDPIRAGEGTGEARRTAFFQNTVCPSETYEN